MERKIEHRASFEHLKEKALRLKREKNYSEAHACFDQLLERDPQNNFYLSNIAHIHYLQRNYRQAKSFAQQAISYNPQNWFAISILGELALKNNEYSDARRLFEDAYHINPKEVYLINRLAQIYRKCGEIQSAINLLKEALLENPHEGKFYQNLGDLYKSVNDIEQARKSYQQAINLDNKNNYAFTQWVSCTETEKSRADILKEVKKLLNMPSQKDNQFLRSYYGKLLNELGMVEESVAYLESAVKADPRNLYRKTQLAASYNKQQLYQKAVDLLEPDYQNRVADPFLFYELAVAYLGLDDKVRAKEILITGLKHYKENKYLRRLLMKSR